MKKILVNNNITEEVVAAFLDGNATAQESRRILRELPGDAGLRELLHISQSVDNELGLNSAECEYIPMTSLAATCNDNSRCCVKCEKYILDKMDIECNEEQMLEDAIVNGWLKDGGTALHNIGRHLEGHGLIANRRYKCTIDDITNALQAKENLIAAVDGGELTGNMVFEAMEDITVGEIPDHTVVILSCNTQENTITIYDPDSPNAEDTYPIEQFIDAWNDSKNYLVTINTKDMNTYNPRPIDITDVVLTEDLDELREAIAENAHEVWAVNRLTEGWSYGPQRDDNKKENPCMVPYSQLPESEKDFDRNMAMNTIKLLKKLGYDLIERKDTELYRTLKERIRNSQQEFHCPECNAIIYKKQVFCDKCGHRIDIDWSLYE